MTIYTCPKCGGDLVAYVLLSNPPIPSYKCLKCDWRFEDHDTIERVPFDRANLRIVQCKNCVNLKDDWCDKKRDSPDPDMDRECPFYSYDWFLPSNRICPRCGIGEVYYVQVDGKVVPRCLSCGLIVDDSAYAVYMPQNKTNFEKVKELDIDQFCKWYWWMLNKTRDYTDSKIALKDWLQEDAK